MADPLADPDDLAAYWRPLTAAEQTVALGLIQVASALIRGRISDIDARISDGTLDDSIARYAVTEMVKSAVEAGNRPTDAKSTTDTAGPFARSVTYAAASRITLTDDLVGMLGGGLTPAAEIGSIRLGRPHHLLHETRYPCAGEWR